MMTLLIGLYYFYFKSHNNKQALLGSIEAVGSGVLPTKVTCTRWLAHLSRSLQNFLKTFKAYEAHLSTASHKNAKAEGLCKLMIQKNLLGFIIFLKEILDPLMKLSLKLQKTESSLADCYLWVDSTIDLLQEYKSREIASLSEMLSSGTYEGIKLKGATPSMAYKESVIDGFIQAIRQRFDMEGHADELDVFKCTHILHLKNWPAADSKELQDFGVEEVKITSNHFIKTITKVYPEFTVDDPLKELDLMKKVMYKRYGEKLQSKSWCDIYDEDFPMMMMIVELLNCFPPTSVNCETTFSQMKLVKTSRRTKLKSGTLNDILLVKLESQDVTNFDPSSAVDKWLSAPLKPRLLNYKRKKTTDSEPILIDAAAGSESDDNVVEDQENDMDVDPSDTQAETEGQDADTTEETIEEKEREEDCSALSELFNEKEDDNDFCDDFISETDNWALVFDFSRD